MLGVYTLIRVIMSNVMLSFVKTIIAILVSYILSVISADCCSAECCYADYGFADCCYADCHDDWYCTEFCYSDCSNAAYH